MSIDVAKSEWVAIIVTGLVIPLLVWLITSSLERQKIELEYLRIAIGVLQPSDKTRVPQRELRAWAVEVLQKTAPVKLRSEAAKALVDGEANFGGYVDYPPVTPPCCDLPVTPSPSRPPARK